MSRRSFLAVLTLIVLAAGGMRGQAPDLYDETVLRTLELTFAQSNWYQLLEQNYGTGVELPADLTVDGVVYPDVGVRFRGFSSYNSIGNSQKKPFNISMDAFVSGQRLYGHKSLNLNNGFRDPTFVREVLCYHVFRHYMPSCRANWVVLRVNGENWGVYVNVQQINKDMMREWFVDEDGARYEADATLPNATTDGSALTWLGSSTPPYEANYDLKNPGVPNPWSPLIDACDALNNGPITTLNADVQPELAVDSALWMLAGQVVFVNPDSYLFFGHNYWLYHDAYHDRMQTLPWGLNMTMAATILAGFTTNQRVTFNLFYNENQAGRPLMNRLWAVPELRERYLAHARTIFDEWFDWSILQPRIATYQALIAAEVAADTKKLYPTSAFTSNVTQNYSSTFLSTITGLQVLVDGRRPYLLGHAELSKPAPSVTAATHQPTLPAPGQTVWVTATVMGPLAPVGDVVLYSRTRGAFDQTSMYDDGMHMDGAAGDDVFGAALPASTSGALVDYYVGGATEAASGGAMTFLPRTAEFAPLTVQLPVAPGGASVQINEFLAKNNNGILDEFGEHEDWIEIHNPTAGPVDVSGMYLTDNLNFPMKWMVPPGNLLQPGETMLIFADNEPSEGPLHATFKLSADGEEVGLYATNGVTLLDAVVFGPQEPDISTGLLLDGGALRVTLLDPSPDAPNRLPGCGSRGYSALDSTTHDVELDLAGSPVVGTVSSFQVRHGLPGNYHYLLAATAPQHQLVAGSSVTLLLTNMDLVVFSGGVVDAFGELDLPLAIPNLPSLVGVTAYFQTAATTATGGTLHASNGLEITVCP